MIRKLLSILFLILFINVGYAQTHTIPRKIAVLHGMLYSETTSTTNALLYLTMPIENMGYEPVLFDVTKPLPDNVTSDEYAGIVAWVLPGEADRLKDTQAWLVQHIQAGMRVALLDSMSFPMTTASLAPLGLTLEPHVVKPKKLATVIQHEAMGFETPVLPSKSDFIALTAKNSVPWLQLQDENNQIEDAVAITPWGGYALDPYVLRVLPNEEKRWIISPFAFLRAALQLQSFPQPDVTTENGRRLMMVHIDGDGFISGAEWMGGTFAGDETKKLIFDVYKIPTTVSIIQGELSPSGLITPKNKKFIEVAQAIYQLPWVEIASHTYSHPFNWQKLEQVGEGAELNLSLHDYSQLKNEQLALIEEGDNTEQLNLPAYQFSAKKEIQGSSDFIDTILSAQGKKTVMLLWSGDCNPSGDVVKETYNAGLYNLNFGDTIILRDQNSLTRISPLGLEKEGYYQVFASNQNENVYTNDWTGPFYGYERVIETFELTDKPYRYKPIDVYYHFYSLSKKASYHALQRVYDWALSQNVFNIYTSEYAQKVLDWRKTNVASKNGGWEIRDNGSVHELRIEQSMGYPSFAQSKNVIGYSDINEQRYIHLGPAAESFLMLQTTPPTQPYLADANAVVSMFEKSGNDIVLRLKGHLPVSFTLANMKSCIVRKFWWGLPGKIDKNANVKYQLGGNDTGELRIVCGPTALASLGILARHVQQA